MESEKDAGARPPGRPVPAILMYHSICPYEDDPYDITVRPGRFDQQMRWLRRAGWGTTSAIIFWTRRSSACIRSTGSTPRYLRRTFSF